MVSTGAPVTRVETRQYHGGAYGPEGTHETFHSPWARSLRAELLARGVNDGLGGGGERSSKMRGKTREWTDRQILSKVVAKQLN